MGGVRLRPGCFHAAEGNFRLRSHLSRQLRRLRNDHRPARPYILHETITGNRIVKAFGMESWEVARFRTAAKRLLRANLRSVAAAAVSSPLMDTFGAVAIALLLLLGRNEIRHGAFTPGTYLAFIALVFKLYEPIRKFALFNNSFQQAVGASSEIFKFTDSEDDVPEKPG